jgi:hypothetical protein
LARVRSISCACNAIARPRPVDHTRVGREWVSRASRAKRPRLFVAGGLIFVFFFRASHHRTTRENARGSRFVVDFSFEGLLKESKRLCLGRSAGSHAARVGG